MGYIEVAKTSEIPVGAKKVATIEGTEVLIANVDEKYYAIGNKCTHMSGDLFKGTLEGNVVTCPRHGAKFDITTGKVISGPKVPLIKPKIKDESSYEIKVEGQSILVRTGQS